MMENVLDLQEVTFDEALNRLRLGGDMDMLVTMRPDISKVVMQVRDDWLLCCFFGSDGKPYSCKLHLVSEEAVLLGLIRLLKNALHRRAQHENL